MSSPDPAPHPLRQLWGRYRRYRGRFTAAVTFSTLNKVADVMPELIIGAAIDVVVRGQGSFVSAVLGVEDRFVQLAWLAVLNVVVWVVESASDYAAAVLWRGLAQSVQHDLRVEAYEHVQSLDVTWHEDRTVGGTLSVLNDDVNQLERFLDVGAPQILQTTLNVVLVGAIFAVSSVQLLVLAFLPIPLIVVGSLWFQRRLEPLYDRVREAVATVSGTVSANLSGVATIKAFGAERRERDRVDRVSRDYVAANQRAIRSSAAFVPLIRMAILTGFTATLLLGGWAALRDDIPVGLYSVLVFMTQRLLWPLTEVGTVLDLYQRAMASTRRVLLLLDERAEVAEGSSALASPVRGRVELAGVRAGYRDGPDVLHGVDLVVPAGETHAVVGSTGAGKSTLLKLLLRFHDPRSGAVRLDGTDLRDLEWSSLRAAIGYVSQDVFLFHGTVAENIAYGRPDASRAEVEAAARAAEAHDFVTAMPDGYDTVVGERGQTLSGGQRQRLALARAVLLDPPLLVLDEATSAVDNETEAAIHRSLARLGVGRTVVLVAHRLSTVRDADRIWVLDGGRVAESGTHEDLLARGGRYTSLWQVQAGIATASP